MTRVLAFILATSFCCWAQQSGNTASPGSSAGAHAAKTFFFQSSDGARATKVHAFEFGAPVVTGAPYSAATVTESVQTLADGNRIVRKTTGAIARDSEGRTRQDASLPSLGNLSATHAPHLVFIQDPVAHVSYTLNLTDKTAEKINLPSLATAPLRGQNAHADTFFITMDKRASGSGLPKSPLGMTVFNTEIQVEEPGKSATEDLGSETIEGVLANGVRTTRTIPAGQIGNEKPINIVTEVWTSPELNTIVSSKRTDPRMGEDTFQLKDIMLGEPDPSLFTVPADFKIIEDQQPVIYKPML